MTVPVFGKRIRFDARGSVDPDGLPIAKYEWDFHTGGNNFFEYSGDGSLTLVYANAGVYEIALRVTDATGKTDVLPMTIEAAEEPLPPPPVEPPRADYTVTVSGNMARFDGRASGGTRPVEHVWNLEEPDEWVEALGPVHVFEFSGPGTYDTALQLWSADDLEPDVLHKTVTIL